MNKQSVYTRHKSLNSNTLIYSISISYIYPNLSVRFTFTLYNLFCCDFDCEEKYCIIIRIVINNWTNFNTFVDIIRISLFSNVIAYAILHLPSFRVRFTLYTLFCCDILTMTITLKSSMLLLKIGYDFFIENMLANFWKNWM